MDKPGESAAPQGEPESRAGWVKHPIGCHWRRGPYAVSTIWTAGRKAGYILLKDRQVIAEFITWEKVMELTKEDA